MECPLANQEAADDATLTVSRLEVERRRRKSEESALSTDDAKIRARTKVRERIKAARLSGHQSPLAILASKEAALDAQSAALTTLGSFDGRRPDPNLLVEQ